MKFRLAMSLLANPYNAAFVRRKSFTISKPERPGAAAVKAPAALTTSADPVIGETVASAPGTLALSCAIPFARFCACAMRAFWLFAAIAAVTPGVLVSDE